MKRSLYLMAAAASTILGGVAQAQILLPPVELRGVGATTVGDVNVRVLNCIGNPGNHVAGDIANNRQNRLGSNSGSLSIIAPGAYSPPAPTATNPALDCETQEIQPNFEGRYIGIGSGGGRQVWRTFTSNPPLTGAAGAVNPFGWGAANVQFAFSEAPVSVAELAEYNTRANNAVNGAGPAIQVPFYVIPLSFAYSPVYGVRTSGDATVNLTFNNRFPTSINGVVAGGIRLNKAAYCGIVNGRITNWNHPDLQALNGRTSLHDPVNDTAARWAADGAPIRLIGRADRSGASDVFTRAMAAQCNDSATAEFPNRFERSMDQLPFDNTSVIDIRRLRADVRYFPGSAPSNFAGSRQSLGGLVFDRVTNQFCRWNEVNNTTRVCDISLAAVDPVTGVAAFDNRPTPGLFTVADGSTGVAAAIELTGNNALVPSASDPTVRLNGKLGYLGADFTAPTPGRTLFSAALQVGTGTRFALPSTANAVAAFGTVLPPQATTTTGALDVNDPRQLGSVDPYLPISATNPATPVSRANPLHWAAVLYNPNIPLTSTLANPAAGYPVTGTAFLLTYTCFRPTPFPGTEVPIDQYNPTRFGMAEFMGIAMGRVTRNSTNGSVSANTFRGTSATTGLGILTQSNAAGAPTSWTAAINDTFVRRGTGAGAPAGALNLWIQDTYPTTAADVDGAVQTTDSRSNPVCNPNTGA